MNISKIKGIDIEAIAACVPKNKINNRAFAKEFFQEDMESTITALGIEERHTCKNISTTSLDLSIEAASLIFNSGSVLRKEIGGIVFVTLTPDNLMPNNASLVQYKLGLPGDIPAFDLNHACSGYVYGLWNASLIAKSLNKKILLLDGDVNSKYVSQWDKSTGLLFGDAGTASVISPTDNENEWIFTFTTDGSNRDAIIIPGLGFRNPIITDHLEYKIYEDGSKRRFVDMKMDGGAVFTYVVNSVPKMVTAFFEENELFPDEFNYLILHQANAFMLRKLARKIGFDLNKMPISINKYGNTSSASIPLNICSEIDKKEMKNLKMLLIGMGAGLSTGIASINTSETDSFGVHEVDL
jgi:3-oxoacyl-[acyl-carrier-protein] synthase III